MEQGIVITDTSAAQAIIIKHALKWYRLHHTKVNTAYTPKAMMAATKEITGLDFSPRNYLGAEEALEAWIQARKAEKDAKAQEAQNDYYIS